jgi:hypothetical protein
MLTAPNSYMNLDSPLATFTNSRPARIRALHDRRTRSIEAKNSGSIEHIGMLPTTQVVLFSTFVNGKHWLFVKAESSQRLITISNSSNLRSNGPVSELFQLLPVIVQVLGSRLPAFDMAWNDPTLSDEPRLWY